MSSFYEDASLVMIPSGYKTSKVYCAKPTDGAGDLTFTRSNDTATRVNSAGLIEKVRTNFCRYSQDFASWTLQGTPTRTTGVTDPNGGTTAATISNVSTTGNFTSGIRLDANPMTIGAGGKITASVYLKGSGTIGIALERSVSGTYFFETTSVTLTSSWVRYTFSPTIASAASGFQIYVCNFTGSTATSFDIAFVQVEQGDIATDYIPTTSAAVSVGPVANVPRLDYLNSSCPRLLLEPQRTNVCLWSENFDNTGWNKTSLTLTANAGISPDGYQNADLAVPTASDSYLRQLTLSFTSGTTYTASIYIKSNTGSSFSNIIRLRENSGAQDVIKNISITTEWTRFDVTITATSTSNYTFWIGGMSSWSTGENLLVWGAQVEAGAYATSYIPTLGAAVTRGADATYKGSISSLIGATEGVLFVDFIKPPTGTPRTKIARISALLTASGNSFVNSINLDVETNGNLRGNIVTGGVSQVDIQTAAYAAGTRIKMALAYKANDVVLYINGTQIGTDTSAIIPVCTACEIASYETVNSSQTNYVSQALLFKTRLTNSELAALTTL